MLIQTELHLIQTTVSPFLISFIIIAIFPFCFLSPFFFSIFGIRKYFPKSLLFCLLILFVCRLFYLLIFFVCRLFYLLILFVCSLCYLHILFVCRLFYLLILFVCRLFYLLILFECS